jgi:hypothetical protein
MEPKLELLSPWIEPINPAGFARELQIEVLPGHPLDGKSVTVLAQAKDRNDVLFAIHEGPDVRYAVLHLTWRRKPEINATWPFTRLFESLESWLAWMKEDHFDYTWGEPNPEQDTNSRK